MRALAFFVVALAGLQANHYPPGDGQPARSAAARAAFVRLHHCPATGKGKGACPGYIVDHVTALACGGADVPANMQWQTKADAKAKDAWERRACAHP